MNSIAIPISELRPALSGLGKIISKRTTLPVLNHIRVERDKSGRIELSATDLDTAAIVTLATPAQGDPVVLLVPLEDLSNAAKSCARSDTLFITPLDHHRVTLKFSVGGTMIEHHCESLPPEEFPPIVEIRAEPEILSESLRSAIHEALACASTDETRLILNGAYLDVSKPGAHYVVGTDGRHLFSSNSFTLGLAESLVVPTHPFLKWKGFNEDGDWRLRVKAAAQDQPTAFELASEHWRYVCRSIEGNYPNWQQVVPAGRDFTGCIELAPDGLESVIQTITRLPDHDERHHTIGIQTEAGRLHLLAKGNPDQPWTPIEVPGAKATGKAIRTFIDRQLLLKALRFGLNRIDLIDALSPFRFCNNGRQMIVMPVRADAGPSPASNTVALPSAPDAAAAIANQSPQQAEQQKEEKPLSETNGNNATALKSAAESAEEQPKSALELTITQLETLRGDLRNAATGAGKLGDLLKKMHREQKASEKEIQSVRATLRSLQSVRI